jgi:MFS family permease
MPTLKLTPGKTQPLIVLGVVLAAAYAINLDTTIVNVALPTLNVRLGAGTSALQWVVDGYNLAFAALVLAGGNIGDRYGRRETLAAGLGLFAVASVVAAYCHDVSQLITVRFVMGAAAALIYPTTLSIITNTFPDRVQRAKAIGAWGAVAGLGVATGPMIGGLLIEHFWWGSVFVALIPVALIALVGALAFVPSSRLPDRAPLDRSGLVLSVAALGALVWTIIEAPVSGWLSPRSLAGFALAAGALVVFVRWERSRPDPMFDVRLFANLRFSAASTAVTLAFFALFGFIFLITQYFQQLRDYGALATGVRILPVAISIAVSSVVASRLVVRFGNKAVVATGLVRDGVRLDRPIVVPGQIRPDRHADGAARNGPWAHLDRGDGIDHGRGPAGAGRSRFGGQRCDARDRRDSRGGHSRQRLFDPLCPPPQRHPRVSPGAVGQGHHQLWSRPGHRRQSARVPGRGAGPGGQRLIHDRTARRLLRGGGGVSRRGRSRRCPVAEPSGATRLNPRLGGSNGLSATGCRQS